MPEFGIFLVNALNHDRKHNEHYHFETITYTRNHMFTKILLGKLYFYNKKSVIAAYLLGLKTIFNRLKTNFEYDEYVMPSSF